MGTAYKILVFTLLVVGLVFARGGKNHLKVAGKKAQNEHYWTNNQSGDIDNIPIERKRSHKRRRKVRKPVKGLR